MNNDKAKIDYSYFIGQKVVELEQNDQFIIRFSNFSIRVECLWRLRDKAEGVVYGYTDFEYEEGNRHRVRNEKVQKLLQGKTITNMCTFESLGDLLLEFDNRIYLDVYHCSSQFEGWELFGEESGISFWTMPGGELNYPVGNPLVEDN